MKLLVFVLALGALLYFLRRLMAKNDRSQANSQRSSQSRHALMDRQEALSILGLDDAATDQDVIDAHRRLMQRVHPDKGGSAKLAQQLNDAKRSLLARN